jgi:hypothetical protein
MNADREIPLRITVHRPPPGVMFAVQRGANDLLSPSVATLQVLVFDFRVRVAAATAGAAPRLLGEFTQGPPASRFVYVNSGRYAAQSNTTVARRAKVPLGGISAEMIESVIGNPTARIETDFEGTGRDGGPTCATVKSIEWRVVQD